MKDLDRLIESIRELDEVIELCEVIIASTEDPAEYDDAAGSYAGYVEERDTVINEYVKTVAGE